MVNSSVNIRVDSAAQERSMGNNQARYVGTFPGSVQGRAFIRGRTRQWYLRDVIASLRARLEMPSYQPHWERIKTQIDKLEKELFELEDARQAAPMVDEQPTDSTVIKVECGWCGLDLGEKLGHGVEGTSHGICSACAVNLVAELKG